MTLAEAYDDLVALVAGLDEQDGWAPTGCPGWCVRDLVFHLTADAQRALVAVHTPADGPATTDRAAYWRAEGDGGGDAGLRATRAVATAFTRFGAIAALHAETSGAAVRALEAADPDALVRTQGHVLTVADLAETLLVEAALHHLDLVHALDRPGPGPAALAAVRRTAEALVGPYPAGLSDREVALQASGRAPGRRAWGT